MTTTIIESDTIGSSYVISSYDYRRSKSIRKFLVHNAGTDTNMGIHDDITRDMKGEDAGNNNATPLGPVLNNEAGSAIVHPIDATLPLQTVEVAALGADKYLVTASYFIIPGVAGGAANLPNSMSMRAEVAAKRVYTNPETRESLVPPDFRCDTGGSAQKYSIVTTVGQVKIRLPFFTTRNPASFGGGVLQWLGGRNRGGNLGGIFWPSYSVRFDGISMDESGGLISEGGTTYKYKGFYEFTARSDFFFEEYYNCETNAVDTTLFSVNPDNDGWDESNFLF
tara:strand:+ start:10238 stop:11080 length:843 start_codon:yes stop_codon:yes gene_type:complete